MFYARIELCLLWVLLFLTGCNLTAVNDALKRTGNSKENTSSQGSTEGTSDGAAASEASFLGAQCSTLIEGSTCVALKYVVYLDSENEPIISKQGMERNISKINKVWSQCKIAFHVEDYVVVDPAKYNLTYNTSDLSELNDIRQAFKTTSQMLVVTTGRWDRSGTLGNTGANAWTSMPGEGVYGAILERPVGSNANIIAHELGHYLNLYHEDNTSNLMNPIIYSDSDELDSDQCSTAKSALTTYWSEMLR